MATADNYSYKYFIPQWDGQSQQYDNYGRPLEWTVTGSTTTTTEISVTSLLQQMADQIAALDRKLAEAEERIKQLEKMNTLC